ncbi:hypothetical protein ETD86_37110 [Nonomuraea turkmeniaca]|uniref:Uncharacterized protein n=1 Tax=Nonomuraea turkmeniaca TaxID=103838 RepID=A0A5S4F4J3_9ACTN|nr:hypothetical protein [Nonomuraea turkmeniaca]TMR11066.1 hypothetical protein ETD86_37110 [Nonomuraea turkmeniaca]
MSEREFIIRATLDFEYKVKAESADDAAQMMNDGEGVGQGECVGCSIEAVVSAENNGRFWHDEDDERAKCAACGHLLYDGHTGRRYYDREKRTNKWPNACDEYGCDCLVSVEPEQAEAVKA